MTGTSRRAELAGPAAHGGAQRWLDGAAIDGEVLDLRPD